MTADPIRRRAGIRRPPVDGAGPGAGRTRHGRTD